MYIAPTGASESNCYIVLRSDAPFGAIFLLCILPTTGPMAHVMGYPLKALRANYTLGAVDLASKMLKMVIELGGKIK